MNGAMMTRLSHTSRPSRSRGRSSPRALIVVGVLAVLGLAAYSLYQQVSHIDVPYDRVPDPEHAAAAPDYIPAHSLHASTDAEHFKYGSIGSDTTDGNGLPYWIWRALPEVCPDLLPGGYTSLGLVQESGVDRPIGFSKRRTGFFDSVGLNCALCHTATVRESPEDDPRVYLAATSHQLDLWGYFNFVFSCGTDDRFTPKNVMKVINEMTDLSLVDKVIYWLAIKQTREALEARSTKITWIPERPLWGPGRVDTFNPYKTLVFDLDMSNDSTIGTADFMVVWNQAARDGIWVHWDGNNDSVDERNLSAAIGAGASPASLDHERIERVRRWIWYQKAPPYPFEIDSAAAKKGKDLYDHYCASCHESTGEYFGKVTPVKGTNGEVGLNTDPERMLAFDEEMARRMNTIGEGYPWQFDQFRSTDGYVNSPIDGAWLRAPYLHNGSVPTLRHLLEEPEKRPKIFCKGNDVFDQDNVGFQWETTEEGCGQFFRFDTRLRGNGNTGHSGYEYGTELTDREKDALVEYLKTL